MMQDNDHLALHLLHARVSEFLEEASALFKPGFKTTFIARNPRNDEQDVLITDDTIPALEALLVRMRGREQKEKTDAPR